MEPANSSTSALAKQGVAAVGNIIGGALFLATGILPLPFGLALGGIAALVGTGAAFSRNSDDKKIGGMVAIGGLFALAAKLPASPGPIRAVAGTLLVVGAIGFLVMGIWKGLKFLRGLKQRA